MSRPRFSEIVAVAWVLCLSAAPAVPADDALVRPELDKEIALEMKDADVVDVFRHIAATTGVPFSLEFESDPSLTVSFSAKNMSVRAVLSSIAHTYELKYVRAGNQIAVQPTGAKPAPRPAARPVKVTAEAKDRPPVYEHKFEVRLVGGRVLSTPQVSTHLNHVAEIRQGIERSNGTPVFATFKVTPKADLGNSLELFIDGSVQTEVSPKRTHTEQIVDTKVVGRDGAVLFTSEGVEFVLSNWALAPEPLPMTIVDGSVYELRLELRRACGSTLPLPPVTVPVGETAEVFKIVTTGPVNACIGRTPPPEFMRFKLSPRGRTADGLVLQAHVTVRDREADRGSRIQSSGKSVVAGHGETVIFRSHAGNELVLTGWGAFEQAAAAGPPQTGTSGTEAASSDPVLRNKVDVAIPARAAAAKIQGTVTLAVLVDEKGEPAEVKLVRRIEHPHGQACNDEAVRAAKRMRWHPAMRGETPVTRWITVNIPFGVRGSNLK